jgi:putative FmdB family regulatory protein
MPLYEYQCDECGGRFERIRKFSDPPLDEPCPKCGGPIRKLISSPAIQFKGQGWYVTDYAKSGSSESKSDSGSSSESKGEAKTKDSSSESKSESKSENKTETKAESKPAVASEKK